jgi:hypothetical protein
LIDSTPPTGSLLNGGPPVKPGFTNPAAGNPAGVPEGYHRKPFNPVHSAPQQGRMERLAREALLDSQPPGNSFPAVPALTNLPPDGTAALEIRDGYVWAGFDKLSAFPATTVLEPHGLKFVGQIPDDIKSLNGKTVAIKGFMMPLLYQNGLVSDCLLLKNQSMCCYGVPPKVNEWVIVHMTGKGIKSIMDRPVTICGTLRVGEYLENGRLRALYRMDGEKINGPADSP